MVGYMQRRFNSIWQHYCLPLGDVYKHQAVLVKHSWKKVVVCPDAYTWKIYTAAKIQYLSLEWL